MRAETGGKCLAWLGQANSFNPKRSVPNARQPAAGNNPKFAVVGGGTGSNQWPLPCETGVGCLRINDMRAGSPIASRTCCHLISLDITQCHDRTVPKLSQRAI